MMESEFCSSERTGLSGKGASAGIRRPRWRAYPGGGSQDPSPLIPPLPAGMRRPRRRRSGKGGGGLPLATPSLLRSGGRIIITARVLRADL